MRSEGICDTFNDITGAKYSVIIRIREWFEGEGVNDIVILQARFIGDISKQCPGSMLLPST